MAMVKNNKQISQTRSGDLILTPLGVFIMDYMIADRCVFAWGYLAQEYGDIAAIIIPVVEKICFLACFELEFTRLSPRLVLIIISDSEGRAFPCWFGMYFYLHSRALSTDKVLGI